MQSAMKHEKRNTSYQILPPRVIIFDVLAYYDFRFDKDSDFEKLNEFSLWGYFKLDKGRNLWYIFPSLSFMRIDDLGFSTNGFRISFQKLVHLNVFYPSRVFLKTLIEKSKSMNNLTSLTIFHCKDSRKKPNGHYSGSVLSFENLFSLRMYNVKISSLITIRANNLKRLSFEDCSNMLFQLSGLKELRATSNEVKCVQRLLEQSPNLEKLNLHLCGREGSESENWFLLPSKNKLSKLRCLDVTAFDQNDLLNIECISHQLERLSFSSIENLNNNVLFNYNYPKLKEISLYNLQEFTGIGLHCSFSKSLVKLWIWSLDALSDSLFQINEFSSLEVLTLLECYSEELTGRNWKPMKSLKTLEIESGFLSYENTNVLFPLLKIIKFKDLDDDFCGYTNEQTCNQLESINVSGCFDDQFLQENGFEELKELEISHNGSVSGENWNFESMKRLERITIKNCPLLVENKKFGKIMEQRKVKVWILDDKCE